MDLVRGVSDRRWGGKGRGSTSISRKFSGGP